MTISQHLINIQRAKFLSWYYFKELPSSCMNTHLHTYVDQRTLSALGNFCNVCLPQNLFLSWCRNSLSYFQQVRSKGITLEKKKTWDFSIYLFTQTASITRRNRRPNRRQASHVQQPPTCWMQWEKKLCLILHRWSTGDYLLPVKRHACWCLLCPSSLSSFFLISRHTKPGIIDFQAIAQALIIQRGLKGFTRGVICSTAGKIPSSQSNLAYLANQHLEVLEQEHIFFSAAPQS